MGRRSSSGGIRREQPRNRTRQTVDGKPDSHDFGLITKIPLSGHSSCIKNVTDKIMGPNRTALNKWDKSRVRTLRRQTLDLALPVIQVRLEGEIRNLHTELLEPLIEREEKEQQLRRERQGRERLKKSRKISIERKTRRDTLLEKLRADREKRLTQEK